MEYVVRWFFERLQGATLPVRPLHAFAILAVGTFLLFAPVGIHVKAAEAAENGGILARVICRVFSVGCPNEQSSSFSGNAITGTISSAIDPTANARLGKATTTIVYQTIEKPVIERVVERVVSSVSDGITEALLNARLEELESTLSSRMLTLAGANYSGTYAAYTAVGALGRIESLDDLLLTNATVNGISGLTDADIPDTITASNYLPLSGGSLTFASTTRFSVLNNAYFGATATSTFTSTGWLGIGTSSPAYTLDVNGTARASDLISKGPIIDARAFGCVEDGVTDDYVCLTNAIAYAYQQGGGTVLIYGTLASSNMIVKRNKVGIVGVGSNYNYHSSLVALSPWQGPTIVGEIAVTSSGAGYTSATTVTVSGACEGVVSSPIITAGALTGINISDNGSCTSGPATVTISDPGGGSGATATLSTSTPLLLMGSSYGATTDTKDFGPGISSLAVDCTNIAASSSECIYSTMMQDQSFIRNVFVKGYQSNGIHLFGTNNQFINIEKVSFVSSATGGTALRIYNSPGFDLNNIFNSGAAGLHSHGIYIISGQGAISNVHCEYSTNCVTLGGSVKATVSNVSGHSSTANVINILGSSVIARLNNIFANGSANSYVDPIRRSSLTIGTLGYIGESVINSGVNTLIGGNTGVGTLSPLFTLDVQGSTGIAFRNSDSIRLALVGVTNSQGSLALGSGSTINAFIAASGNSYLLGRRLGVGTSSPFAKLSVQANNGDTNTTLFAIASSTAAGTTTLFSVSNQGNVTITGSATTCMLGNGTSATNCSASDQRLKDDITPLDASSSLAAIRQLNPVSYKWNTWMVSNGAATTTQFGFIARQVAPVFSNLVTEDPNTHYYKLDYQGFIAPIVGAIQALANKVGDLAERLVTKEIVATYISADKVTTKELCLDDLCISKSQLHTLLAQTSAAAINQQESTLSADTPDTEPPVITVSGNNPAHVAVGANYADLGALVTDNVDKNLGIKTYLNGTLVSDIVIDTSIAGASTIDYVAIDQTDNTATSTRVVIVEASSSDESVSSLDTASTSEQVATTTATTTAQ